MTPEEREVWGLNVLHVWTGGDSEGRAVRDETALALSPEQEAALVDLFAASLFSQYVGIKDSKPVYGADRNVHIEIRACLPVEKPRG